VPDVYLLTEGADGRVAVPHLTLTFDAAGLALDKTDGEPVWFCGWDKLREMAPVERSVLPDGRAWWSSSSSTAADGASTASCWPPTTPRRRRRRSGSAPVHVDCGRARRGLQCPAP
jgi:hypothetical protein